MTSHLPALHLSRRPEQLLLAPDVATAVELLPARATACCAFVRATVNLLNLIFIWR